MKAKEHVCPWWLAYTFDNPLRRFLHDPEKLLSPYIRPGMKVADIGCGMGYFSIEMARMVGDRGAVIAVDIQQEMLEILRKRAAKKGMMPRIRPVLAAVDDINVKEKVDFVLTFWMVHETGEIPRFLSQVSSILKESGKLLIAEPKMHVTRQAFEQTLEYAEAAKFRIVEAPRIRISRAVLLSRK